MRPKIPVVHATGITLLLLALSLLLFLSSSAGDSDSHAAPSTEGLNPGPDIIMGAIPSLQQFGSSGTQVGLAMGTDSCNGGDQELNFFAMPNTDHPVMAQNLYRMSGGTANNERFEQIGQSWITHGFFALQQNACNFGCAPASGGTHLGVGCSNADSASINAGPTNLGSRAWVNPFTGLFPSTANSHTGHTHTDSSHRLLVERSDLNTTLNPGATYYAESQYITPHEYAWCQDHAGQCNMANNASYRQFNVAGTTSFVFSAIGSTVRMTPAINAWPGATIRTIEPAPGVDGRAFLAYKVTGPVDGMYHYEYAIYNQNLDRGIQSFFVPIFPVPNFNGVVLANIGFHAPPQHPGFANDGTQGDAGYSNAVWTFNVAGSGLLWHSETFEQNANANAIRWGTLYNFRFDSALAPANLDATVGFFKTGEPVNVQIQGPQSCCGTPPPTPTPSPPATPTPTATAFPTPFPEPAVEFAISAPAKWGVGVPLSFGVIARNMFGYVDPNYAGTVHFTSSDPTAVLPADSTLTNGTGTFTATFHTAGSQTITATDTQTFITGTSNPINVIGSPPTPTPTPACTPLPPTTQGFEDISILVSNGWHMQNNSQPGPGSTGWFQGNSAVFPAQSGPSTSYIGANFTNGTGTSTLSNWLLTPQIPLRNGMVMTFWTRTISTPTFPDRLQVRMSTNAASTNVGTTATDVGDFTRLLLDINPTYSMTGYPNVWAQVTATVTGLPSDTTGRLAFRYFVENGGPGGANSDYIGIDNIQIYFGCQGFIIPTPTPGPPTPTLSPAPTPRPTPVTPTPTPHCNLVQGFDDIASLEPAGWFRQNNSQPGPGTTAWFQGNSAVFPAHLGGLGGASSYIGANFNNGSGTSTLSNWLLTPTFTLQNGVVARFWTRTVDTPGFPDRLQVRMSTNGASTNVGTNATDVGDFTTLLLDINPTYTLTGYPTVWTEFQVTVTGVPSPTTGRLALRYFVEDGGPTGGNSDYIGIDTFQVNTCGDPPPPTPTPTASPPPTPFPEPAVEFAISAPAKWDVGVPLSFGVIARNMFGNVDPYYAGTVHFTSSDPTAVLPADSTLTNGTGTFTATFHTAGSQTITATDTQTFITGTSNPIEVIGSTPTPTPTATPCTATIWSENFDGTPPPGWVGGCWSISTIEPDTPPNDAFCPNPGFVGDCVLDSPGITIPSASSVLSFRNNFDTDFSDGVFWDGGVLEVSSPNINGGDFVDVTHPLVGGSIPTGGYTGEISGDASNPLAGRMAWSGNSKGYIDTVVNLGPHVNGQTIQLRWRFGSDNAVSAAGWRIDTIRVTDGPCEGTPTPTPTPTASPESTPTPTPTPGGTATPTPPGQALNLSTRLRVQTGDNAGIGGFIITGTAPKHLLFRGIGPSLTAAGVSDALANPTLDLRDSAGVRILANNDWRETQEAEIFATGIPPIDDLEAAIVETLEPGSYTVILRGMGMTSGVGLVEIYDLDDGANSKLANLSTRAFVSTGNNVVIAGFILGGTGNDRVVVRGIGPSLTAAGVANALLDPTLELRDSSGTLVLANNNWQDDPNQAAQLTAAGLAPTNNLESGVAATLSPGLYTAVLAGQGDGMGVGLVEVYDLGTP